MESMIRKQIDIHEPFEYKGLKDSDPVLIEVPYKYLSYIQSSMGGVRVVAVYPDRLVNYDIDRKYNRNGSNEREANT